MKDRPQLAAANAALDACAALFKAQTSDGDRQRQTRDIDDAADRELERLSTLASWIESTMGPICADSERPKPGSQTAAAAIAQCATRTIGEQRERIESERRRQIARLERGFDGRALRFALDRYFSHFEVPDTRWQLRWHRGEAGMPSATAVARTPIEIEAEFGLALPPGEPWWQPIRLDGLAPAPRDARLQTGDGKAAPPSKYWLVELDWDAGTGALVISRSRKKGTGMARIAFPGDGVALVTAIGPDGAALGPATAQDPVTNGHLQEVWTRLSQAVAELVAARGSATSLRFESVEVERTRDPGRMGVALLSAIRPQLRDLRARLANNPELIERLRGKFADLPERYRAMLERAGLADGATGVEVDMGLDLDEEQIPTEPFLEAEEDEPMFGSSTIDKTFDRLRGEARRERTLPGYPGRPDTAPPPA